MKVTCWCPKCENEHFKELFWTGTKKVRKFCENCAKEVDAFFYEEYPVHLRPKEKLEILY